jgi:hypothetical protein
MARPTIFSEPMTSAERMRLHRARKRAPPVVLTAAELKLAVPMRRLARLLHCSERHCYHFAAFQRHSAIKWSDDILNGKHGGVGAEFLAEVCEHGDAAAQKAIRDKIMEAGAERAAGAPSGRPIWGHAPRRAGRMRVAIGFDWPIAPAW